LDVDEYLFPLAGPDKGITDFQRLLLNADPDIGSLLFYWCCFGTNYTWKIPPYSFMIETLTMRAPDHHPSHIYTKAIHRPEAVVYTLVHEPLELKSGYRRSMIDPGRIRINHYYLRDQNYCLFSKRCLGSREELGRLE